MKPFRWNIARREQLGRLSNHRSPDPYAEFRQDLRRLAAATISAAGDTDLVFVGRSAESVFDYLSGSLLDTSWSDRLHLLNVSMRASPSELRRDSPYAIQSAMRHLEDIGLAPNDLVHRKRPIALVDLVNTGSTFKNITELILHLASESKVDLGAVRSKLRYVGISWRTKNSPNTFRWHQHAKWLAAFPPSPVKNVSIAWQLWGYLGNNQPKVVPSNPPWRWASSDISIPPRGAENAEALSQALALFDFGRSSDERKTFSGELAKQAAMTHRWCRSLVLELRGKAAD